MIPGLESGVESEVMARSRRAGFIKRRLSSWEEFLEIITDSPYSNWAFRGHREQRWPLFSSLSRYLRAFGVDYRAWPEQEERMIRIFRRKAHHFLSHRPDPDDELQWVALMQHHGAPTRLLDFTWSPYVAAFFALERATGEAAVWALNSREISRQTPKASRTRIHINPRIGDHFGRYFLKGKRAFVWIGEPQLMNRRLVAQSGTFAIPGILDKPMEEILRDYPNPDNILAKFILPADKIREKGLRELYRMNITNATLFPDLEGLARSLGYELEFHWAYDPRTMQPI